MMSHLATSASERSGSFTTWRGVVAVAVSAAVAAAGYAAWLPWHATKRTDPVTLAQTGPYEPWQVIGVIVTVGVIALVGGWMRLVLPTTFGAVVGVTSMFSANAATQTTQDANMWPVGAVMLIAAAWVGVLVVAFVAQSTRNGVEILRRRRR